MARIPYASAVGSLTNDMMWTQPDIVAIVLGCFQKNFGHARWKGVNKIFRYLHRTMGYMFTYQGGDACLWLLMPIEVVT